MTMFPLTTAPPEFITGYRPQEELRQRAHRLIPGGAHTYSKGDDQFPANAPAFIARGQGAAVWDTDGHEFLDWGMGLRSVVLGHAYPRVIEAVQEQLLLGANFVRPSPIEADLAEMLVDLIPAAEMVKFAKDGSDTTSAALRLARAFTGRDRVVICRDNPFYSFNDWFIGTTPTNAGVPQSVTDLTLRFPYHDLARWKRSLINTPARSPVCSSSLPPPRRDQGLIRKVTGWQPSATPPFWPGPKPLPTNMAHSLPWTR